MSNQECKVRPEIVNVNSNDLLFYVFSIKISKCSGSCNSINNCECGCECDKSCDISEYLDYSNFKCRKKLVDKLIEECTKSIDKVEITEITQAENEHRNKCNSCTLYIILFSIFFTFSIGIATYFAYFYWYLTKR